MIVLVLIWSVDASIGKRLAIQVIAFSRLVVTKQTAILSIILLVPIIVRISRDPVFLHLARNPVCLVSHLLRTVL